MSIRSTALPRAPVMRGDQEPDATTGSVNVLYLSRPPMRAGDRQEERTRGV